MTPRYVPDIMGYKWDLISGGGVTIFCYAKDPKEGDLTVCWGQTASYGELALGEGAVRFPLLSRIRHLLTPLPLAEIGDQAAADRIP